MHVTIIIEFLMLAIFAIAVISTMVAVIITIWKDDQKDKNFWKDHKLKNR